jgi:hypothetical protein
MRRSVVAFVIGSVVAVSSAVYGQYTRYLDGSTLPGANGWAVDGDGGVIVPLGGGNFGIQQTDNDGAPGSYDEYYVGINDASNTLAARFRVDSYMLSAPMDLIALTAGGNEDTPAISIGIRNVAGQDRWTLLRFIHDSNNPGMGNLLDIAPVVLGQFNDALIHIDRTTDLVRFSWNGVERYNAITPTDHNGEGYPEWGASNFWSPGGTSVVTYDWVGYGVGYIPEPSSLVIAAFGGLAMLAVSRRALRKRTESRQLK